MNEIILIIIPFTVMSKVQLSVFPEPSVDVKVTEVVPIGKLSPGLSIVVSVWLPELSVAVGSVQVTLAVAIPASVFTVWLDGHPVITGFSTSNIKINVK